jgi:hypothetical protein
VRWWVASSERVGEWPDPQISFGIDSRSERWGFMLAGRNTVMAVVTWALVL